MADPPKRKVRVNVREIVNDVKSGMKQDELVRKHRISPGALARVTEKILRAGHVRRADLHPSLVSGIRSEKLAVKSAESGTTGKFTLRLPESLLQSLSDKGTPADADPTGSLPAKDESTSIIMEALAEVLPTEKELLDRIDRSLMMVMPSEKFIESAVHDAAIGAVSEDLVRTEIRAALNEHLPDKDEILDAIASSFVIALPDAEEIMKRVVSEIAASFEANERLAELIAEIQSANVSGPAYKGDEPTESAQKAPASEQGIGGLPRTGSRPIVQSTHRVRLSLDDMGMLEMDEEDGFEPTIELNDESYRKWTVTAGKGGYGRHGPSETLEESLRSHLKPEVTERGLRDTVTIDLGVDDPALQEDSPGPLDLKEDIDEIDLTMSMEGDSIYVEAELTASAKPSESEAAPDREPPDDPTAEVVEEVARAVDSSISLTSTTTGPTVPESDGAAESPGADDLSDSDFPTQELTSEELPISKPTINAIPVADSDSPMSLESAVSHEDLGRELDCQLPAPPSNDEEVDEPTNNDETPDPKSTQ